MKKPKRKASAKGRAKATARGTAKARGKGTARGSVKASATKIVVPRLVAKPLPPPERPIGGVSVGGRAAPRAKAKSQIMRELSEAYRVTFSTAFGKLVKADLMQFCGIYSEIAETDPVAIGKRLGERNMALRIVQMVGLRPEHFEAAAWGDSALLDQTAMA